MKKILIIFMTFILTSLTFADAFAETYAEKKESKSNDSAEIKKDESKTISRNDPGSSANSSSDFKIGVVDIDRITLESKTIRNLIGQMESIVKTKQEELDKKESEYRELKRKLEQQREVLSKEQTQKKELEIGKLKESIDDLQYEINKTLRRSEKESIEPALEKIVESIKTVAEEKKLAIVIRSDTLLYMHPGCDITDEVIAKMDKQSIDKQSQDNPQDKPSQDNQSQDTPQKKQSQDNP